MNLEARAIKRYIPGSPRKMRLVADLIRGKSVEEALDILHNHEPLALPNGAAEQIEAVVAEAYRALA